MDADSSDGEHDHPAGAGAPVIMETGVGLKPQMDSIFAEVEKSLPNIDFDLSDVSSDSEEPVIFHRNLKMFEHDYDDEKDMDTSLSGDSALDFFKGSTGMIQIPSVDKNNASITESSTSLTFDNDLAALLAAQEGSEDGKENVSSWNDLEKIARRDKQLQQESREQRSSSPQNSDITTTSTTTAPSQPPPPLNQQQEERRSSTHIDNRAACNNSSDDNREIGIREAGDILLAQLAENNRAGGSPLFGGRTVDHDIVLRRKAKNAGTSTDQGDDDSINEAERERIGGKGRGGKKGKGEDSNKEAERARQDRAAKERKKKEEREEMRRKEKELALTYMSAKAPHLSTQILDAIDLDSSLENENELNNWTPPPALRAHLEQRSASRTTAAASASGASVQPSGKSDVDDKTKQETENLTLIQKLAKFSLQQAGKDYNPSSIDPQTGATVAPDTITTSEPITTALSIATESAPKAESLEQKAITNVTYSTAISSSPGIAPASSAEPKKQEGLLAGALGVLGKDGGDGMGK